ncbi:hypothetical protein [Longimonas halophila]|nr:hypothetical protein [Longimonas halophila]
MTMLSRTLARLPQVRISLTGPALLMLTMVWISTVGCAGAQSDDDTSPLETRNDPIAVEAGTTTSDDVESRNGAITIGESAQVGNIVNRNGAIVLQQGAQAASIETRNGALVLRGANTTGGIESRNGRVTIGAESTIGGAVETRNGNVTIERESTVDGDVETRNGSIETAEGVRIQGEVETRNGTITLSGTQVDQLVDARNGDIRLRAGTVIRGDVRLLMHEDWDGSQPPVLSIDGDSRVEGRLIVDERARVEIASGADVPDVERFASREAWERQQ